jgi:D-xylose 1-dehydrogenase (NADP+, D-xylono-1,5-lactone-forming)
MSDRRALRWGLLSTARINRNLIPAMRATGRSVVSAVASRDLAKAAAYAQEWSIPGAFGSYEELVAAPHIDAIYISLPNSLHAEWAVKAADAGKHVLIEKPIALTVQQVDAIAAAAQRNGVVCAEAYMYRHHAQTQRVKAIVDSGQLGEIRVLRCSFSFQMQPQHHIRLDPALGGGALWDIGCYPISYMQYLMDGAPDGVQGSADIGPTGVDEQFAATLRFGPRALGVIDISMRTGFRATFEVVGSDGMLTITRPFKPQRGVPLLIGKSYDALEPVMADGDEIQALGEVADFERAVLDGAAQAIPLSESRRVVATIDALLRVGGGSTRSS